MRSNLKYLFSIVVSSLFIMSTAALGQNGGINFGEVDGWEKGDISKYPTAELGYSIPYQSADGGIVTIYVYNGGLGKIADGIDDIAVKNEIRKAEGDIKSYGEAGYYSDVKLEKQDTVNLQKAGERKSLYSLFTFKVRGTAVYSEIYLFGYKNQFIKIRATRSKTGESAKNETVTTLLDKVSLMLN